ncbi:hypothetical protein BUALT_Bualt02G0102100 [Buddleja alternifolia]|uniref:Uncharacterized protein n=1 Tax=Buddleja alternifolia TaxID=168488 RepID=A0AAV6XZ52_9LAMI|nr:hypothetical protein BUALT_Bualt02G0102100 [Buddleja alternifolia]
MMSNVRIVILLMVLAFAEIQARNLSDYAHGQNLAKPSFPGSAYFSADNNVKPYKDPQDQYLRPQGRPRGPDPLHTFKCHTPGNKLRRSSQNPNSFLA